MGSSMGVDKMFRAVEYRKHAQECRVLARNVQNEEHKKQLLKMAEAWDKFGEERERSERSSAPGEQGIPS